MWCYLQWYSFCLARNISYSLYYCLEYAASLVQAFQQLLDNQRAASCFCISYYSQWCYSRLFVAPLVILCLVVSCKPCIGFLAAHCQFIPYAAGAAIHWSLITLQALYRLSSSYSFTTLMRSKLLKDSYSYELKRALLFPSNYAASSFKLRCANAPYAASKQAAISCIPLELQALYRLSSSYLLCIHKQCCAIVLCLILI